MVSEKTKGVLAERHFFDKRSRVAPIRTTNFTVSLSFCSSQSNGSPLSEPPAIRTILCAGKDPRAAKRL